MGVSSSWNSAPGLRIRDPFKPYYHKCRLLFPSNKSLDLATPTMISAPRERYLFKGQKKDPEVA